MDTRNLILAVALSLALLLGFDFAMDRFYPEPEIVASVEQGPAGQTELAGQINAPTQQRPEAQHTREGGLTDPDEIAEDARELKVALAAVGRIKIDAPEIAGSLNPVGARVDDIVLKTHRKTVKKDSGPVRLFAPAGTPAQQFAQFGWVGEGLELPDAQTEWQSGGGPLTQEQPVTLTWDNETGQAFAITFSIDEHYMLSAEQAVVNSADGPVVVQPYSFLNRTSRTASVDAWNVHSGPIGAYDGAVDFDWDYDDVDEEGTVRNAGLTSWIGFTDVFWLAAIVPEKGVEVQSSYRALGSEHYRADVIYDPVTVPAGKKFTRTTQLFVGAKESAVLDAYEYHGIELFGLAIDWGWFRWFEKPIFWLLTGLYGVVGNFGVAIILLTMIIRLAMFPIAQKQFHSMAQMRAVQPKMKALQERYKDDKPTLQKEMGQLYKDEGVNPLAGCLPIFLQIPIFFALYKTLMIAIEMRHKPFVLWIQDLSAPDPATVLNLFGLLPFDPPSFLAIGVLAVLLGATMWLQFKLNPAAMDPMQQQIFMIMPWFLMFVMAPFAAGLLLYWITSNILTLAQQSYLYARNPQLKAQMTKDREEKARVAAQKKADK